MKHITICGVSLLLMWMHLANAEGYQSEFQLGLEIEDAVDSDLDTYGYFLSAMTSIDVGYVRSIDNDFSDSKKYSITYTPRL